MRVSVKKQLASFRFAFSGISYLLKTQPNAWIQCSIAVMAIIGGVMFRIEIWEWLLIIVCIGMVLSLEAINTSIERLADTLHPGKHEGIGTAKDVAAGAVLIASAASLVIGLIIFLPRLVDLLGFLLTHPAN